MMTRSEEMLALRKRRMAAAPAILSGGFRPFFFAGAAWALIALALWLFTFFGIISLPSAFGPMAWHRHEMLFGFVGAVIAGFLLTAIPNWTGRLPIAGAPLAALFGLWLGGRFTLIFSDTLGLVPALVFDPGFYLILAFVAGREVLTTKNRNAPIVVLVLLFALANGLDYACVTGLVADDELGCRAGISLVLVMISLIGGRIIPSFTRNWMTKEGIVEHLPTQPGRFDFVTLGLTAAALVRWILLPYGKLTGFALGAAGILQALRLWRWRGWRTVREPLVFILYVGYSWLAVGLLLLGWSIIGTAAPRTAAIHALTAGAMATMILAVMTRATLGHTGRNLRADNWTRLIYGSITLGAILRVASPLGAGDPLSMIRLSGVAWVAAFGLFLLAFGPMLFSSQPAGKS